MVWIFINAGKITQALLLKIYTNSAIYLSRISLRRKKLQYRPLFCDGSHHLQVLFPALTFIKHAWKIQISKVDSKLFYRMVGVFFHKVINSTKLTNASQQELNTDNLLLLNRHWIPHSSKSNATFSSSSRISFLLMYYQ